MDDVNVIYYAGTLDRPFNPPLNHGAADTSIIRMSINGNANYSNTGYLNDRLWEERNESSVLHLRHYETCLLETAWRFEYHAALHENVVTFS